eukprot:SAG22_NODE_654_length_8129_cov_7.457410_3_plen_33_part_00
MARAARSAGLAGEGVERAAATSPAELERAPRP